jgi:hypothetical protein
MTDVGTSNIIGGRVALSTEDPGLYSYNIVGITLKAMRFKIQSETIFNLEQRYVPIESPVFHRLGWKG